MTMSEQPKTKPPLMTRPLADIQPAPNNNTAPLHPAVTGPLDTSLPWVIELRVVGTASTLQTRVTDSMVIGRSDNDQRIFPEIDLLPYNAFAMGVSRKHAVIEIFEGRLYLKDLNSTNGTRLNNVPLHPHQRYRIRHGDQIMIGQLRLQVLFAVVPAHDITSRVPTTASLERQTQELARLQHHKHLLVIEDDLSVAEVFRVTLERAGYRVTCVNSVVNALSVVIQAMPDVIVLDLMLPDFNGLDFLRYVRKNNPHPHVPIIAISASSSAYQKSQAMDAGADDFMAKPVSVEDIVMLVSKHVGLQTTP
jgi:CheY-like chemotaxis protein